MTILEKLLKRLIVTNEKWQQTELATIPNKKGTTITKKSILAGWQISLHKYEPSVCGADKDERGRGHKTGKNKTKFPRHIHTSHQSEAKFATSRSRVGVHGTEVWVSVGLGTGCCSGTISTNTCSTHLTHCDWKEGGNNHAVEWKWLELLVYCEQVTYKLRDKSAEPCTRKHIIVVDGVVGHKGYLCTLFPARFRPGSL